MSQTILSDKKESEQDDREPLLSLSIEDLDTRATETKMSDHEDCSNKTQPEQKKKIILGMSVKRDTTIWNLIAMATWPALLACIVSFISALTPLILHNKDFFGIDQEVIGAKTAETLQYGQIAMVLLFPLISVFVDTSSRSFTASSTMISVALMTWIIPYIAPNFPLLCILRASINVCIAIVDSMPLIADYVKKESRGLACCMTATFVGAFQIVNFQILVPYSETVSY